MRRKQKVAALNTVVLQGAILQVEIVNVKMEQYLQLANAENVLEAGKFLKAESKFDFSM